MGDNRTSSLKTGASNRMSTNDAMQFLSSNIGKMSSSNLSVGVDSFTSSEDGSPLEMKAASNTSPLNISNDTDQLDSMPFHRKNKSALDQLQGKIFKTKEKIKKEQTSKEENVNEYLKLSNDADKQQLQRIKAVFEKKNLKSAQTIGQLQKKLEDYNRKAQVLSTPGSHHKSSKGVLKDVGQGLRDFFAREPTKSRDTSPSITGKQSNGRNPATLPGMAKNKDGSIVYKGKYGSADNIVSNALNITHSVVHKEEDVTKICEQKDRSEDELEESSALSDSIGSAEIKKNLAKNLEGYEQSPSFNRHKNPFNTSNPLDLTKGNSSQIKRTPPLGRGSMDDFASRNEMEKMRRALAEFHESRTQMNKALDQIKNKLDEESSLFRQALDDEREKCERLEDQINDLTELYQNEVYNIKQELCGIQEKMEYQLEERARDIQECLVACQTKVTKMELQQQQQQIISVESIENSNLRSIITKLINVLLAVLAVLLVLVSGVANLIGPFLQTRFRVIISTALAVIFAIVVNRWNTISTYLDTFNPFLEHSTDEL